jgi:hypothetical protein
MAVTVKQVQKLVRSRGALGAAIAAAGVIAFLMVKDVVQQLVSFVSTQGLYALDMFSGLLPAFLTFYLPFGVGFFLCLWLIAPLAEELRIGHVITRAILAVGVGATLAFVVLAVTGILGSFVFDSSFFGNSFPFPSYQGASVAQQLGYSLQSAIVGFVSLLPLGVLAGVLLWHWRKTHPVDFAIEGLIDV